MLTANAFRCDGQSALFGDACDGARNRDVLVVATLADGGGGDQIEKGNPVDDLGVVKSVAEGYPLAPHLHRCPGVESTRPQKRDDLRPDLGLAGHADQTHRQRGHVADVHAGRAVRPDSNRTFGIGVLVAAHILDKIFVANGGAAGGCRRYLIDRDHALRTRARRWTGAPSALGWGLRAAAEKRADDGLANAEPSHRLW